MKNPFKYGKVAENECFIDRNEDRKMLKNLLYSGNNVILMSPRRWGKSSLVKQSMKELLEEYYDVKVCFFDAFSIHSSQEFYQIFSKEVIKSAASTRKQWTSAAKKYLKSVAPVISLGADPQSEFSLSFDFRDEILEGREVLNLPETIARDKNVHLIVCIDEFQSLSRLSDYGRLEDLMRSVWQHQQNVSYCLYGSQRHFMSDIFNDPKKPFYRFGQMIPLKKIPETEWIPFIESSFARTKKQIPNELAVLIPRIVKNHSWYVQQFAGSVWNYTESGGKVSEKTFLNALEWMIDTNEPNFQNIYNVLNGTQVGLLKAICNGETKLTSSEVMQKYALGTSANVLKNKAILMREDYIDIVDSQYEFVDPVFEIWFRRLSSLPAKPIFNS